jgi:hypothetical protein
MKSFLKNDSTCTFLNIERLSSLTRHRCTLRRSNATSSEEAETEETLQKNRMTRKHNAEKEFVSYRGVREVSGDFGESEPSYNAESCVNSCSSNDLLSGDTHLLSDTNNSRYMPWTKVNLF